jgi:filamentous hemagglutinin family protein
MNTLRFSTIALALISSTPLLFTTQAFAQVIPDSSLKNENSTVFTNQSRIEIHGGATRNQTLFHSFKEFNIGNGENLYFIPQNNISQIISRITGNNVSQILGNLGVQGSANLYLMNSNGFIFGPNATLDIKGSLLVTTGKSFEFSNFVYGTTNPQSPPVNVIGNPKNINFEGIPGTITVLGNRGEVLQGLSIYEPANTRLLPQGLSGAPGKTIALIGGNIQLIGGVITAPSGTIEIAGIRSGKVEINNTTTNLTFTYPTQALTGDITLRQGSILNASGLGGSQINLFGKDILFTDHSVALIENLGFNPGGHIRITALGNIDFIGISQDSKALPPNSIHRYGGVLSQTFIGEGASVSINAENFNLTNTASVYVTSFGTGATGAISLNAKNSINQSSNLEGDNLLRGFPFGTAIATFAIGSANASSIEVNTNSLSLRNGSTIISTSLGAGNGGNLTINANESIFLNGYNPISFYPSYLSTSSAGSGRGGDLTIKTPKLRLENSARIDSSAVQNGVGGNINIFSDTIEVIGTSVAGPTIISSSGSKLDPILTALLNLNLGENASSGSLNITTQNLKIQDGAVVAVRNDTSQGDAGRLLINARNLSVINGSSISASTNGGNGGEIRLNVGRLLFLDSGLISATAAARGTGGNISINTTLLAARYSNISANAQQAQGGQIQINTQGLFIDPNTRISASSGLGPEFSGNVRIVSQTNEIIRSTKPEIALAQPVLEAICQPTGSNSLTIQAFGGAIVSPTQSQSSQPSWGNTTTNPTGNLPQQHAHNQTAVSWRNNPNGTVDFINATQYIQDVRQGVCGKPTP